MGDFLYYFTKSWSFLSRNDSGSDTSPTNSRAPSRSQSRIDSAAERFSRRMSYIPPRLRKNSISKSAQKKPSESQKSNTDGKDKSMSALSKRSVKNFDDKKYRSSSHLTPVDW